MPRSSFFDGDQGDPVDPPALAPEPVGDGSSIPSSFYERNLAQDAAAETECEANAAAAANSATAAANSATSAATSAGSAAANATAAGVSSAGASAAATAAAGSASNASTSAGASAASASGAATSATNAVSSASSASASAAAAAATGVEVDADEAAAAASATAAAASAAAAAALVADGDKGDVIVSGGGTVWQLDANTVDTAELVNSSVTNAKLANMVASTIKGRISTTGAPQDLTAAQVTALLNLFDTTHQGLAPASGGGTSNFLRADGSWAAPPGGGGGGGGSPPGTPVNAVQFNNPLGTFAGDADFTWVSSLGLLDKQHVAFGNLSALDAHATISVIDYFNGDFSGIDLFSVNSLPTLKHTGVGSTNFWGLSFQPTINADSTGPADIFVGTFFNPVNLGSGALGFFPGMYSIASQKGAGAVAQLVGFSGQVEATTGSGFSTDVRTVAAYRPSLDSGPTLMGSVVGVHIEDHSGIGSSESLNIKSIGGNNLFTGRSAFGTNTAGNAFLPDWTLAPQDNFFGDYSGRAPETFNAFATLKHTGAGAVFRFAGMDAEITIDPGSTGDITTAQGLAFFGINDRSTSTITGGLFGMQSGFDHAGLGTVPVMAAVDVQIQSYDNGAGNPGIITNAYGVRAKAAFYNGVGAMANISTYYAIAPDGGLTNTNTYGFYIEDHSGIGTSASYNIFSRGASSRNVLEGVIELGHVSDTTLSRSSAGVLAVEGITVALNSTSVVHTAGTIELGAASDTTLARSGAGAITVEGVQVLLSGAALGTPASGTLTNCTGLPLAGLLPSTLTALGVGTIELGNASDTTIARSGAGAITVEGVQVILSGAALGTPASGTLTNCLGLPVAGITPSTVTALGVGTIELGNASDTTLSRLSAGVLAVEGTTVAMNSSSATHMVGLLEFGITTNAAPLNGDTWYDGTHLNFQTALQTKDLLSDEGLVEVLTKVLVEQRVQNLLLAEGLKIPDNLQTLRNDLWADL